MARQGLKQIGEHMNVVTRTMSADPSGNSLIILRYFSKNWQLIKGLLCENIKVWNLFSRR